VFLQWLKHFSSFVFIVDGHSSHKYVDVLSFAKENGIVMMCLPPHCTLRVQHLDVSFYGKMKTYYDQEDSEWLKANPGRILHSTRPVHFLSTEYGKAATIANAQNAFRKTGIWSINADIFEDLLFAPA
jgi:hypothetical protein